ncbi:MAG TPA: helix-turn-helix transcriptional regulator [Pseudonocardiaceae bacterium]|nr:helix-turn-helix transcriptional regulator [Pseudonocardiaceae bacterium]
MSRDKLIAPPRVPAEFWRTEQFRQAFAAQHMGRVARVYRAHPQHFAAYGPGGISQSLLGQWLGIGQAQISRIENGPPIRHLDTLRHWSCVLRIPAELLWFRLPPEEQPTPSWVQSPPDAYPDDEAAEDPERELVLAAPWNHRGTVEAAVVLSGGDGPVKRRVFLALTGPALTFPAHQWLVREPGPLASGLAGRRVSGKLVGRFSAMVVELRRMDDVAGGGSVLPMAQQAFSWVAGLLDRASYDERTGQGLHTALAELGQLCGWSAYDAGRHGLAQRYFVVGLRAAHSADDRPLGAHILATMAHQASRHGRPADGVTFIETALAGTRGQAKPALLAELHIRQAHAFAVLHDASACTAAISQARTQAERLRPEDDPLWLYWLNPANITIGAGRCLLRLDRPDQAAVLLDEGINQLSESFIRERQVDTTYLAEALARPGKQRDLDAAAALGMQSISLAESLDSTRGTGLLRDLSHRLTPHAEVPAVRDFLERARSLVA